MDFALRSGEGPESPASCAYRSPPPIGPPPPLGNRTRDGVHHHEAAKRPLASLGADGRPTLSARGTSKLPATISPGPQSRRLNLCRTFTCPAGGTVEKSWSLSPPFLQVSRVLCRVARPQLLVSGGGRRTQV
jgi:hypothetical protein